MFLFIGTYLAACRNDMYDAPRYDPLEHSPLFKDGSSARPALEHTVARGDIFEDPVLLTGRSGGAPVDYLPLPLTRRLVERGRSRFTIYCAPCHGQTGEGDGMIVQRGFPAPPSFHTPRLHDAPIGHFVDVMTNGYGAMYSYAGHLAPRDRWAVAAYIRALQLSRSATLDDVPADQRRRLEENP
jgi:cytochrome c553